MGELDAIPTFPCAEKVVEAIEEVDDAWNPAWNQIGVFVALARAPKFEVGVNQFPTPPEAEIVLHPNTPAFQVRALEAPLQVASPTPESVVPKVVEACT